MTTQTITPIDYTTMTNPIDYTTITTNPIDYTTMTDPIDYSRYTTYPSNTEYEECYFRTCQTDLLAKSLSEIGIDCKLPKCPSLIKGKALENKVFENFEQRVFENIEQRNIIENFDINFLTKLNEYQQSENKEKINYLEANLLEAISVFNNEYNNYTYQCKSNPRIYDPLHVPDVSHNIAPGLTCHDLDAILNNDGKIISDYITNNLNSGILDNLENKNVTDASYQYIINKHKEIKNERANLDDKLKDLYDIKGSRSLEFNNNFDSTIYTGILITVISSVALYYTFKYL